MVGDRQRRRPDCRDTPCNSADGGAAGVGQGQADAQPGVVLVRRGAEDLLGSQPLNRKSRALPLPRRARPRAIFLVWYCMELCHRDTAAARACFDEWRSRGGGAGDAVFWCHYAWFEWEHGRDTAARARAVAEAAVAACPWCSPCTPVWSGAWECDATAARARTSDARATFSAPTRTR